MMLETNPSGSTYRVVFKDQTPNLLNSAAPQTQPTISNDKVTAADPISFALPDSTWYSVPTLSVSASMAELSNSTINTNNKALTNIDQWVTESAR